MAEPQAESSKLVGHLRPVQFFNLSFGAIVGVGWIPLLGGWLGRAGSLGAALGFVFGGLVIAMIVIAYLRVATRYPVSGGETAYAFRIFGRNAGFVVGWLLCFSYISLCVFEGVSMGWISATLWPGIEGRLLYSAFGSEVRLGTLIMALTITVGFCWMHIQGTDWAARFQDVMTYILIAVSVAFISVGLIFGDSANLHPMVVFNETGWKWAGVASVFAITPLFYGGFNFAVQAIGERDAGVTVRQVGVALTISIFAAIVFFAALLMAASMAMPRAELLQESMPAAAAFRAVFNSKLLGDMVLIAGILGLITSWNALIFAAVRVLFAMAEAKVIPSIFASVHPTHGTPWFAILFITILTFGGVFGGIGVIGKIADVGGAVLAFAYVSVCFGALRLMKIDKVDAARKRFVLRASTIFAMFVLGIALFEPFLSKPEWHLPVTWMIIGSWMIFGAVILQIAKRRHALAAAIVFTSLVASGAAWAAESEKTDLPKTIVGYADSMTVRPGDTVDFKVSTYAPGPYEAELLRIRIGDTVSDTPLYEVDKIPAPFDGSYPGRTQATYPGSYVHIADTAALDGLESFTVVALIKASTPNKEQHIVSRWNAETQKGWSLGISERGESTVWLGDGKGHVTKVESSRHTFAGAWTLIMARYDASTGKVRMYDEHLADTTYTDQDDPLHYVFSDERTLRGWAPAQSGPVRFGAAVGGANGRGGQVPFGLYNGKLDNVRLADKALSFEDARRLALSKKIPADLASHVVGYWDFIKGHATEVVHDLSPSQLNGRAVNMPMRAMKAQSWTGKVDNWNEAPDQYSAIYFHEDDLIDAQWDTDFSYTIPLDLDSAIYAVRVTHGESESFMPFFVAPPKGKTQSKVALLLPTTTYLSYYNFTKHQTQNERYPSMYVNKTNMAFLLDHDEFGRSTYDQHSDGTAVAYSSWRRPNLTIVPKSWTNNNLVPDTEIGHWIEQSGENYDIITDDLLHAEGLSLLENYRVVISGQHPEYASGTMLNAITAYLGQGGRFMYMGGNGFFHSAAWHPTVPGVIEIRRPYSWTTPLYEEGEAYMEFDGRRAGSLAPGALTDMAIPVDGVPDNHSWVARNLGVQMTGMTWGGGTYYRVLEGAKDPRVAFIMKGVKGEIVGEYGSHYGGAAGEEVDRYLPQYGAPAHAVELALSENHPQPVFGDPEEIRGSLVFFETPSGGAVFSVGSMAYSGALRHNQYDNDIARITTNVLKRFLQAEPFKMPK